MHKNTKIKNNASSSSNIKIDPNPPSYSIEIGLDEEKIKKMIETGEEQIRKIEKLRNFMIDYLQDNDIKLSDKDEWRIDFDKVTKHKLEINKAIQKERSEKITLTGAGISKALLDPSEMDEINEIFNRWI